MSDVFSIFMPGRAHWEEVKRAEKTLLVDARQGGSGPAQLDLDEGFIILRDRSGNVTQASTDVGNPHRMRPARKTDDRSKTAADEITWIPPAAESAH